MARKTQTENWYRLDNAAKLYPAITSNHVTSVFRVSATLKETVCPELLEKALVRTAKGFPWFTVLLKRGLFWYFYERCDHVPAPEKETFYPCMFLDYKKSGTFPFRVLYFNRRISLEVSHSITDGTGAITFLKTLIGTYFEAAGVVIPKTPELIFPEEIGPSAGEDSFHKYYTRGLPAPPHTDKAFIFPFKALPGGEYRVTTGIVDTENIIEAARKYKCTVTQYFSALYFEALQEFSKGTKPSKRYPAVINIPVNLRSIFPSVSLRNFFTGISVSVDFRLGEYDFDELVNTVQLQMKSMITEKNLKCLLSHNVSMEKDFRIRVVPLWMKKHILRYLYKNQGEKRMTTNLSNLGDIKLPKEVADRIERFEFYPPPSAGTLKKVSMLSFNGKIYITFGSLTDAMDIERIFFRQIRKAGIPVKIETNGVESKCHTVPDAALS